MNFCVKHENIIQTFERIIKGCVETTKAKFVEHEARMEKFENKFENKSMNLTKIVDTCPKLKDIFTKKIVEIEGRLAQFGVLLDEDESDDDKDDD